MRQHRVAWLRQHRQAALTSGIAVLSAVVAAGITAIALTDHSGGTGTAQASAGALQQPAPGTPGLSPSSLTSPSPSPSPSVSARPSSTPVPTGSRAAGAHGLPSTLLDLTNWKLTLPIGGSHKPTEIEQPALAGYSVSPYFVLNPAGTGVVFQANAGGVTTSNSGYPRSELREMTGGGRDEASWSTTSGTSTMVVREAVTHLTVAKPQVTVAQVHDDEDDVLVVRLDGPHHLYAEHDGTNYGDLDTGYQLGTAFTVQVTASGGHIRISYNGVPKVDYAKSSSGDYFKAGCYTQSNPDKGDAADAYAQVVIYALTVTHR